MGKLQFEENWRNAFEGAESEVPESVWSKIEIDLIKAENRGNKSMVVLYQRIAAGIALFALSLASYIAYDRIEENKSQMAMEGVRNTTEETIKPDQNLTAKQRPIENDKASEPQALNEATSPIPPSKQKFSSAAQNNLVVATTEPDKSGTKMSSRAHSFANYTPDLSAWTTPEVKLQQTTFYEPNFPHSLPAMPSFYMASNDEKKGGESFYAGLGFAGGSYNPNGVSTGQSSSFALSGPATQAYSTRPQSDQASSGSAYSFGVNIGKEISKRWVLQTGVSYMNQSIDYTSNYTSASANKLSLSVADYAQFETADIAFLSPYTIRSAVEFLAIPVQAGYRIIDRKFDLQLNAGVATDFFLNNTLRDESGQTDKFSQGAGADSPYRTVNWSGLVSFEVSHQLADHYSISLVPGFKYSFNSILKDESHFDYKPLILDVGLRVRYIFK